MNLFVSLRNEVDAGVQLLTRTGRNFFGMQSFLQDLRYSIRQLGRNPGFACVAILTLALGIGANTAIFSVIDSVLLRPLPFAHSESLVQINAGTDYYSYPKGWIREYGRRARSLVSVSGYTLNAEYNVAGAGASDRAFGSAVSVNLFDTLESRPEIGRYFSPAEEQAGQDRVVVLSHSYWRQHFGEARDVIGKKLLLDGINREVIGVAPAEIRFPDSETQFWIPISFKAGDPYDPWSIFTYRAMGRLKDGVKPELAQAELRMLHSQMLTLFPWRMPDNWAAEVVVLSMLRSVVGDTGPRLLLLLGAVGVVLLIACANVANLMLARAATRQREMALRNALGANLRRLAQQMLTESVVLAGASGILGLILAAVSLRFLKFVLPPDTPRLASISLHGEVLFFAVVVSLATGILSGLAPAWNVIGRDLQGGLRLNETNIFGTAQRFRTSQLLVVGQIALAVIVITAAGVMLRSLYRLGAINPGFRTDRVITAQISLDQTACAQKGSCSSFFQTVLSKAQGIPGLQDSALVDALPLTGSDAWYVFDAEGHARTPRELAMEASSRTVSAGYFPLMGIRLLRGRSFADSDGSGTSRAIVINASMAKRLWPNQDPIGKHIASVSDEPTPAVLDANTASIVVGVVSDTRHESLEKDAGWEAYLPLSTRNEKPVMNIVLRSNSAMGDVAAGLRQAVASLNPAVPVTKIRTLDEVVASSTAAPRSLTLLLLAFAILAVGVGSIGVYSLIAYTVSWRTREIGLRLALGANRLQVAMLIVKQSLVLTGLGAVVGLVGSFAATHLMRRFLFETSPLDPLTYSLVPVLLGVLAVLASWVPARRASRVEPMSALRSD